MIKLERHVKQFYSLGHLRRYRVLFFNIFLYNFGFSLHKENVKNVGGARSVFFFYVSDYVDLQIPKNDKNQIRLGQGFVCDKILIFAFPRYV